MSFPTLFDSIDIKQMLTDYPIGDAFIARYAGMSRDELYSIQNAQFIKLMTRGWQVPFYQRLWGAKGIEAGDIRSVTDITKLPVYDKTDLMASIADHPPYGDFSGLGSDNRPRFFSIRHRAQLGVHRLSCLGQKGVRLAICSLDGCTAGWGFSRLMSSTQSMATA
jgi:hypothetical protein